MDRARQLDPSLREFQYPDFGFQDELNLGPQPESKWAFIFDYVKQFPKYERLSNIIAKKKAEKLEHIQMKLAKQKVADRQAMLGRKVLEISNDQPITVGSQDEFLR